MSVPNAPRMSKRPRDPDPHAIDLPWALRRARDWLLGPAPLIANLSLLVFAAIGTVLWRISQDPGDVALPAWAIAWGVLVAVHAGLVLTWGTLHAWRSPPRRPVYYQDIPPEQRTMSRRSGTTRQTDPVSPPVPMSLSTWQGVLAPVTPFPTPREADPTSPNRHGTDLPAAPSYDDVTAVHPAGSRAAPPAPERPALAARDSALADVRDVLASDQPLWRRWRRRTVDRTDPMPLPIDAATTWLAPFPGARPVTRPAPASPPVAEGTAPAHAGPGSPPDRSGGRWPASPAANPVPDATPTGTADGEQIPSLAAMLRSSNLTSMSDAPISGGQPRPATGIPTPMPPAPTPLARRPNAVTPQQPQTMALFAAFGIDGDGKPARPPGTEDETEPDSNGPPPSPRRPEPLRPTPR